MEGIQNFSFTSFFIAAPIERLLVSENKGIMGWTEKQLASRLVSIFTVAFAAIDALTHLFMAIGSSFFYFIKFRISKGLSMLCLHSIQSIKFIALAILSPIAVLSPKSLTLFFNNFPSKTVQCWGIDFPPLNLSGKNLSEINAIEKMLSELACKAQLQWPVEIMVYSEIENSQFTSITDFFRKKHLLLVPSYLLSEDMNNAINRTFLKRYSIPTQEVDKYLSQLKENRSRYHLKNLPLDLQEFEIAHEIGHCWQGEKLGIQAGGSWNANSGILQLKHRKVMEKIADLIGAYVTSPEAGIKFFTHWQTVQNGSQKKDDPHPTNLERIDFLSKLKRDSSFANHGLNKELIKRCLGPSIDEIIAICQEGMTHHKST